MINHELKLTRTKKVLRVYLLGPEVELNQIPIFGELAYLLPPGTDLTLLWVGPAVKGLCDEAKANHPKSFLARSSNNVVLDVRHPVHGTRVQIQLNGDCNYFHEITVDVESDAVLGLNAGIGAYPTWNATLFKIFYQRVPFCFSDQTKLGLRLGELITFPNVVEFVNQRGNPYVINAVLPMESPPVEIKLNPFHGVIGRDVVAVLVPNIDNGYLLVSKYT